MDNERTTSETTPLLSWKSLATQTFHWMVLAAAFGWFGYVLLTSGGSHGLSGFRDTLCPHLGQSQRPAQAWSCFSSSFEVIPPSVAFLVCALE